MLSRPLRTFAHAPSLRTSIGQFPDEPGLVGGETGLGGGLGLGFGGGLELGLGGGHGTGLGGGLGLGLGLGLGGQLQPVAAVKVKNRMLRAMKRAREAEFFEAILFSKDSLGVTRII